MCLHHAIVNALAALLAVGFAGTSTSSRWDAMSLSAKGSEAFERGHFDEAEKLLSSSRAISDSPVAARDHAISLLALGRDAEALAAIDRAIELGDSDPEALEIRAAALANLGNVEDAVTTAASADSFRGDVLAASLGGRSSPRLVEALAGTDEKAALASLLLAAESIERSDLARARMLLDWSRERLSSMERLSVGRDFGQRISVALDSLEARTQAESRVQWASMLAAFTEVTSNGTLAAQGELAARAGVDAAFALSLPVGVFEVQGALRIVAEHTVTSQDAMSPQVLGATLAIEAPLAGSPAAPSVGFKLAAVDTFGDAMRVHHATSVELGPSLRIPLEAFDLVFSVLGSATDFVDGSPPDARVSPQNRDYVGQRFATRIERRDDVAYRVDLVFVRNDARGEVFDAVGPLLHGNLELQLYPTWRAEGFLAAELLRYGPIGDPRIIGAASVRDELRIGLGARLEHQLIGPLDAFAEGSFLDKRARGVRGFSELRATFGLELRR